MKQEYYAFYNVAINPAASNSSLDPAWKTPNFTMYNGPKIDLYGELKNLARSLSSKIRKDGNVPLSAVAFPIQQIFNTLKSVYRLINTVHQKN